MNLKTVKNAITSKFGRQILKGQKHMPVILFGVGVVGVAATVVIACRATLKLHDVLDEAHEEIQDIRDLEEQNNDETNAQKEIAFVYFRTGSKIAAMYAPAFIVGGLSIAALTGSHVILTRRNVALTAAYAALEKGFRQYRDRVMKELGEDKDREFRYGSETREIVEEGKNGPEVKAVTRVGNDDPSIYARWFDDSCGAWQRQPEHNRFFLKCQQNYANDKLNAQGHLFLNEVYDMLGFKRTQAGSVVGWVKGGDGDDYVDFGVFNPNSHDTRDFVNGWQDRVLLDFNVDGVIFDKI